MSRQTKAMISFARFRTPVFLLTCAACTPGALEEGRPAGAPCGEPRIVVVEARAPSGACNEESFTRVEISLGVGTNDFTLSHWYETSFQGEGVHGDVVGDRWDASGGNFFSVRMGGNGALAVELDQDAHGTNYVAIDSDARRINDGAWHHLAYVRHGGEVRLYVDGERIASARTASGEPTELLGRREVRLGRSLPDCIGNFVAIPGAYANVRLQPRALSDADVRSVFAESLGTLPAIAAPGRREATVPRREVAP
jgi:hypothetical protein